MRLVAMLGGCALLAWPSSGGARAARPVIFPPAIFPLTISQSAISRSAISQSMISQSMISETAAPQDSPTASPPSQTAPGTAAPPAREPAAENPPASGAPERTASPRKPEAQSGQTAAPSATRPSTETAKPSSTVRRASTHRAKKKPASATARKAAPPGAHPGQKSTPNASPKKVVVRNGGASDSSEQLSPGLTEQQASSQRQTIDLLLVDTAANLKKLSGRQTTPSQDDTMGQIRQYVQQAKTAADAGDIERAHNLAVKAHLLSEELAKH
jgi:hypothetical protein